MPTTTFFENVNTAAQTGTTPGEIAARENAVATVAEIVPDAAAQLADLEAKVSAARGVLAMERQRQEQIGLDLAALIAARDRAKQELALLQQRADEYARLKAAGEQQFWVNVESPYGTLNTAQNIAFNGLIFDTMSARIAARIPVKQTELQAAEDALTAFRAQHEITN